MEGDSMALIRATCSDCGDVELRSRDLLVRVRADTQEATYVFRCPVCLMREARSALPYVVDVLLAAGVHCSEWDPPKELFERHNGPTITHDDIIDMHELLSSENWFEELKCSITG